jgi:hypothetical protein
MVVLEAAAIGAASYGLYKGGDAAVRKGKEAHREHKRESQRSSQKSELNQKTQTRSERISQLVDMSSRRNGGNTSTPNIITTGGSMNFSTSSQGRRSSIETSTVDDRHRNVMKKLNLEREEENKKGKNKLRFNPFKKK